MHGRYSTLRKAGIVSRSTIVLQTNDFKQMKNKLLIMLNRHPDLSFVNCKQWCRNTFRVAKGQITLHSIGMEKNQSCFFFFLYTANSSTVAQKTAPMFAYYIKTHVLLNADII